MARVAKLRFNTRIYRKNAIREAVLAYSNLAKFYITQNKRYIKVKIEINNSNHSIKYIIADEFANYVLVLTKKCL